MAGLSWGSASILGEIDKLVLENGFNCDVTLIPGGTVPSFTSMVEQSEPDVMGELWPNAAGIDTYNSALSDNRMSEAAAQSPIGGVAEGWYILPNILETHPELTTLDAVLARPDLFPHPEDASKGGFVTCPPGSGCQISNANLFVAYDMEAKGWKMIDPGSYAAEDATISSAHDRSKAWFGYYSAPTAFIGKYDLRILDWGVEFGGQENWNCITKPDCPNPQPSSWTSSFVRTVFTDEFAASGHPDVRAYLGARVIPGPVMNELLLFMDDNQAAPDEVAEHFIANYDMWKEWVSADVAAKLN
jgi:glycine betaine/proline transport system substrate-binding protein